MPELWLCQLVCRRLTRALQHNFLMHALLMFSARHLSILEPFEKQHKIHELQHRQHALGTLRLTLTDVGVTGSNFDGLIAANTLLAFHSCAMYSDMEFDVSTDEWLPLMNGVKNIVKEMWGLRQNSMFGGLLAMPLAMDSQDVELGGLEIMELLDEDVPVTRIEEIFTEMRANGEDLDEVVRNRSKKPKLDLLLVDAIPNDCWDEHVHLVYKKVLLSLLPLLEAVRKAPASISMDMTSNISCALVAWPAMQPDKFVELVQAKDPKALIILAHYYAAMCHLNLEACWWLHGRPQAMCKSICREMGDLFPRYMRWPRQSCGYEEKITVPTKIEEEDDEDEEEEDAPAELADLVDEPDTANTTDA